ncbi:MAG: UvrB/UvrC motif-containing protein [Oscillospiraceae bacterium]|nr:UvrB/UvrC motif-containing protein [Oscillospiraceae bacterium]
MLCQSCGKRQAVTRIKTNLNGSVAEYHLCADCARRMGYQASAELLNPFLSLNNLLGSFWGKEAVSDPVVRCPVCGASFREISQSGKVGCAECYRVFHDQLLPSIQRIHGNTDHRGKVPTGMAIQTMPERSLTVTKEEPKVASLRERRIQQLKAELQTAIAEQNFEQAAVLRDEIKALEA